MPLGTSQYQQSFPSVLPFMDVWRRAQQQRNRSIGLILEFNGGLEIADTTIRIEVSNDAPLWMFFLYSVKNALK